MNDIISKKISKKQCCWNERLKKCMQDAGYTQESFACDLNKTYNTQFTQKTISRWVNLGDAKNGIKGFPDFDNMVYIADFFDVDIGYLTGETDEDSFSLEKACSYIGLNGKAIKAIREITNPENEADIMSEDMRPAFNKFLTAQGFPNFLNSLCDLYCRSLSPKLIQNRVFDIDGAIDNIRNLEYYWKIERYELNEALILLINEIYPKPSLSDLSIKD